MAGSRTLKLTILGDVDNLNKSLKVATNDVETFGDKMGKVGKVVGAAFAAAAAAAGAYAIKIGIEGVKSAIADEKAQTQLALALQNATGATTAQIAATEQSILQMSLATGVADDNLRPALQRLALATGSSSKAQDLLNTALDVSTATGKPLETVANALGKAYEGNTTALGKLGLGLSAAELKTMSFTDVQNRLTDLFGGAAAANAETYAGRLARVQVALDEAKETLGTALLPVVAYFIDLINKYALPAITAFADAFSGKQGGLTTYITTVGTLIKNVFSPILEGLFKAFGYIKTAVEENLAAFMEFGGYIAKYLAPIIGETLGGAFKIVGKVAAGVIDIVGSVVGAINTVINTAIDGINFLIRSYNAIPFLGNVSELGKLSTSTSGGTPSAISGGGGGGGLSRLGGGGGGLDTSAGTGGGSVGGSVNSKTAIFGDVDPLKLVGDLTALNDKAFNLMQKVESGSISDAVALKQLDSIIKQRDNLTNQAERVLGSSGAFYSAESARAGESAFGGSVININVSGAFDKEGTARAIVDELNNSFYRGTGGATNLVTS